jgi:hypothetical protein
MSASTRTVQQPLGIGQLGSALALVALVLLAALLLAYGPVSAPKTETAPAAGAPPAVIDHGWSEASTMAAAAAATKSTPIDHGSSESSMTQTGTAGGYTADPGYAPRTPEAVQRSGSNGPRLRPQ